MLFYGPYIGKCFDLYGQYSESEVAMMRAFLREGSTVIDVGANIGDLTLPLARIVGESGGCSPSNRTRITSTSSARIWRSIRSGTLGRSMHLSPPAIGSIPVAASGVSTHT